MKPADPTGPPQNRFMDLLNAHGAHHGDAFRASLGAALESLPEHCVRDVDSYGSVRWAGRGGGLGRGPGERRTEGRGWQVLGTSGKGERTDHCVRQTGNRYRDRLSCVDSKRHTKPGKCTVLVTDRSVYCHHVNVT